MLRWLCSRSPVQAGLVLMVAALGACRQDPPADPGIQISSVGGSQHAAAVNQAGQTVNATRRTAIVDAVQLVSPAVVSVNVTSRQRVAPRSAWDMFFIPQGTERTVQSFGTGLLIRPDGLILTNQHVVAGAQTINVTLGDGRSLVGKVLGEDPLTDIAVVKIEGDKFPVAQLGQSTDLMIGEWVVALGNPYVYMLGNSAPTVTVGVVSATGRNILPSSDQPGLYLDMIQTDAAINPGNSGGPLVNALGEVVGINSSIFTSSGGSIGLGFAIPIERAVRIADEIVRTGSVRRAWTGLDVSGPQQPGDWRSAGGVSITAVTPGGPAARAGLKPGDVLVTANGRTLHNYLDWEAVKLDLHVGDALNVSVESGGRAATHRLITGDVPTVTAPKVTVLRDLELVTVTPAVQAERGLRVSQGALIFRISDAVGQATGLHAGDVLIGINSLRVRDADQVAEAIKAIPAGQPFRLTYARGNYYDSVILTF
jgi:serine protease Do